MQILNSIKEMRFIREDLSGKIGFVPTMGALHEGHLSLIRAAKKVCDTVIVSIFVNPTQFGPNEDFDKYPRKEKEDALLCEQAGADFVFLPSKNEVYPENPFVSLSVNKYTDILCGAKRPGHFNGVVQIVGILFNIVAPHKAFFGQKDFQQLFILKKYSEVYHYPVEIVACPTVRESDGLAMSSRNAYLSIEERINALVITKTFNKIIEIVKDKKAQNRTDFLESLAIKTITEELPEIKVDYLEIRNQKTLEKDEFINQESRIFAAIFMGKTRLIDNMEIW